MPYSDEQREAFARILAKKLDENLKSKPPKIGMWEMRQFGDMLAEFQPTMARKVLKEKLAATMQYARNPDAERAALTAILMQMLSHDDPPLGWEGQSYENYQQKQKLASYLVDTLINKYGKSYKDAQEEVDAIRLGKSARGAIRDIDSGKARALMQKYSIGQRQPLPESFFEASVFHISNVLGSGFRNEQFAELLESERQNPSPRPKFPEIPQGVLLITPQQRVEALDRLIALQMDKNLKVNPSYNNIIEALSIIKGIGRILPSEQADKFRIRLAEVQSTYGLSSQDAYQTSLSALTREGMDLVS